MCLCACFSQLESARTHLRCRIATRVRVEGRDHGGLGLRSGGEGIGLRMEAPLKKKKNEQEIRSNKIYQNEMNDYKMVVAQAAPNDYDKTLTDEEEKKTLNLSGIPRTLKIGNPHNGALPLLLQHKEGRPFTKRVLQNIPFQSMGIFPLILGEVGRTVLTPTSTRTTMYLSLSLTWMCAQKHITFTLYKS